MVAAAVTGDPPPLQQSCDGEGKKAICVKLLSTRRSTEPNQPSPAAVALDGSTSLSYLVSALSWLLFDLMNAESEWLAKPSR